MKPEIARILVGTLVGLWAWETQAQQVVVGPQKKANPSGQI